MVASDDITLLVHAQAAVGVTIEGKTNIQPLLHNKLLQTLNMRRTGVVVDVRAIRLVVYDMPWIVTTTLFPSSFGSQAKKAGPSA